MAVSKKLRFEIFRRDNFACRYCGRAAMDGAVLEPDHVVPRSRGGRDVATNLVTACLDCNSGKNDTPLNAPVVDDVPQADFLQFCIDRDAIPPRDSEAFEDFEIEAAVAWVHGWSPNFFDHGRYHVAFELAIATRRSRKEIVRACELAGERHDPNLLSYLCPLDSRADEDKQDAAYRESFDYLRRFTPGERSQFIQLAGEAAGSYIPTEVEVIRAAGSIAREYVQEHGRDHAVLRQWLSYLPDGMGDRYFAEAASEWDARWKGARGHSSHECRDEITELAVSYALGVEVPA